MMRQFRTRQQEFDPALYALRPDADQRFRRWIGEVTADPRATLLVAEEGGQTIGFLYATVEHDPPIYVHAWPGRGLGGGWRKKLDTGRHRC